MIYSIKDKLIASVIQIIFITQIILFEFQLE